MYAMEIRVRITSVEEQDTHRRNDILQMTPEERIQMLIDVRDRLYPYQPIERVVSFRSIPY